MRDTSNLTNLVKSPICYKSAKVTIPDVLVTDKAKSFQNAFGPRDCHRLVDTILDKTLLNFH